MFCNNCGKEIEQGCMFCSSCGTRAVQPAPEEKTENTEVTAKIEATVEATVENAAEEAVPVPTPAPTPVPTPVPMAEPVAAPVEARINSGFSQPVPPPPPMPFVENRKPVKSPKQEKPKTFFGKGALALCLIIIGILSCSTTVFATLFFTLLGRI